MMYTMLIFFGQDIVFIEEYDTWNEVIDDILHTDWDWTTAMEFKEVVN